MTCGEKVFKVTVIFMANENIYLPNTILKCFNRVVESFLES